MFLKVLLIFNLLFLSSCSLRFLKVISASFSKEYCSCRYVLKKDKKYCESNSRQIVPIFSYDEDELNKKITSHSMGFSTVSIYGGKRVGCLIIQ
jgi:hypothetical protein